MRRPILPVRTAHRPVAVTRRSSGDTAIIIVRADGKDLGAITQLGSEGDDTLSGNFVNRPAYADYVAMFNELAKAVDAKDAAAIAACRDDMQRHDVQVWHSVHDMRIDAPGTLLIAGGRGRFRPNDAFLMMRTGGL